jgi:TetR/AcrR family transcriptional repressor of nem operon
MTNPKRRGRPPAFQRDAVLDAAMLCFWRSGYEDTSIPDISEATSLSASSIYNAFGSKLDLFVAALDRYLGAPTEFMLGPLEHGEGGLTDLEAFLRRLADLPRLDTPPGCFAVNTLAERAGMPAAVAIRTDRYRLTLRRSLHAALARAAHCGEIPSSVVESSADALTGIVIAYHLLRSAKVPSAETTRLLAAARAIARGAPQ